MTAGLILLAVLYGAVAALVFRRLTDAHRLRQATNQIVARIMEFRLFVDEPSLVWRAQVGAFRANIALLRQIAIPCLIMAALFAIFYPTMERRYGHAPLLVKESTVMTARGGTTPHIDGIVIETPGVRIRRTGEVSWRIRPTRADIGNLPSGVEIEYPRTRAWLVWFFAISSVSALVLAKTI